MNDDKFFLITFIIWLMSAFLSLGLIGFGIWVVIKLMSHFGII